MYTTSKIFSLHHHIDITDDQERVVYEANTKFFSIHDKTDITDASGHQVAHVEKKIFTVHEVHFVTMADGTEFSLSNEFFHVIKDITNIEGLGWQLSDLHSASCSGEVNPIPAVVRTGNSMTLANAEGMR